MVRTMKGFRVEGRSWDAGVAAPHGDFKVKLSGTIRQVSGRREEK
ncbi:hypothetical protein CCP4SC76_6450006 [Gammaproteobacteria bacterium]